MSNHTSEGRQGNCLREIHDRRQGWIARLGLGAECWREGVGGVTYFRNLKDGIAPPQLFRRGFDYFPTLRLRFLRPWCWLECTSGGFKPLVAGANLQGSLRLPPRGRGLSFGRTGCLSLLELPFPLKEIRLNSRTCFSEVSEDEVREFSANVFGHC